MKLFNIKSFMQWGLPVIMLSLLASCGGSDSSNLPLIFSTSLSGVDEVPPTPSQARGACVVIVDQNTKVLKATLVTQGIAGNAAHLHQAPPGVNGPIIFPLAEESAGNGVWGTRVTVSDAQLASMRDGNFYCNVHSLTFPNGEIRGQLAFRFPTQEQLQRLEQLQQRSQQIRDQLDALRRAQQAQ